MQFFFWEGSITFFIDESGNLVTCNSGMLDLKTLGKGIKMITG